MAHFWCPRCWLATQKRPPLPPWAGAVVTEQRVQFRILLKSLHQRHPWPKVHAWCISTQYIQSADSPWEGRAPGKSLTVTACHRVVRGRPPPSCRGAFLPFAEGGALKGDQCCGMDWALLLYYYSVQVLEPFSPKQEKQNKTRAELEDNNFFVFCLVRW